MYRHRACGDREPGPAPPAVLKGFDLPKSARGYLSVRPTLQSTADVPVFAAGDVRSGSTKRVAAAVGEGSMAIRLIHKYIETQWGAPAT